MFLRSSWYLIWAMLAAIHGRAQQLVPNGDFESYAQCPDYVSQIDRATGWSRPTDGTSDYLNACLGVPFSLSVPGNQFGHEPAHSGSGYAGFYTFYATTEADVPGDLDREYVTRALASPLVPGETYAVEFFVSLADVSKYAVNDIGLLFSTYAPYRPDEHAIEAVPQVRHGGVSWLDDKNGWMRIGGCFTADSAYTHITIGNFNNGPGTAFLQVPTNYPLTWFSYYYIDDVSVQHVPRPELGPDITTCGPVQLVVSDPQAGVQYAWSTGDIGPSITVAGGGTYIVHAILAGCTVEDSIRVDPLPTLVPTIVGDTAHDFCMEGNMTLHVENIPPTATALWNDGSTGTALTISHPGSFDVTVHATGFCSASTSVTIQDICDHPIFLPNACSPNGDGINDRFIPVFDQWTTSFAYSVFDRWGREVFHSGDGLPWDADHVAPGVYVMHYVATDRATNDQRSGSGHITVIR